MIQTTAEARNGWQVVRVAGRADSESSDALEGALRSAVEANPRVATDFSALTYISNAGLLGYVLTDAQLAGRRERIQTPCKFETISRKVADAINDLERTLCHGAQRFVGAPLLSLLDARPFADSLASVLSHPNGHLRSMDAG